MLLMFGGLLITRQRDKWNYHIVPELMIINHVLYHVNRIVINDKPVTLIITSDIAIIITSNGITLYHNDNHVVNPIR